VVVAGLGYVIYRRYFSHIDIFATSNVALIIIIYSLCSSSLLIINKARGFVLMRGPSMAASARRAVLLTCARPPFSMTGSVTPQSPVRPAKGVHIVSTSAS